MTETTETVVLNIHNKIAELLTNSVWYDYNVYVCDDGGGPYLSLNNPENEEDYRCLSLSEESCSDDLSLYRWNFWNSGKANLWLNSKLGADATEEDILAFLAECLAEEARQLAAFC